MGIDYLVSDYEIADEETIKQRIRSGEAKRILNEIPTIPLGIFDLDEVLVNIGIKWIALMRERKVIPPISDEEIVRIAIQRESYYFYKHFGLEKECYEVYQDNPTFYDDLRPTRLGANIDFLVKANKMNAVIITHCVNGVVNESKKRFIEKYFPHLKTFYITDGSPKSTVINRNNLNSYVTFSDDSVKNLMDVARNTLSFGKEFYVPRFGHNGEDKFSEEDKKYLLDNGISLVYYKEVI